MPDAREGEVRMVVKFRLQRLRPSSSTLHDLGTNNLTLIVFLFYNIDLIKGPARHRAVTRFIECLTHSKCSSNVRYHHKDVGSIYQRERHAQKLKRVERGRHGQETTHLFSSHIKLGRQIYNSLQLKLSFYGVVVTLAQHKKVLWFKPGGKLVIFLRCDIQIEYKFN